MPSTKSKSEVPNIKVSVTSSFTGKIPNKSYGNASPFFSASCEWELPGGANVSQFIKTEQERLHGICVASYKKAEQSIIAEEIRSQLTNVRFYTQDDGVLVPSVTSILSFDKDWGEITPEQLEQYASQGTIVDIQVKEFHRTGVWQKPDDIVECFTHLRILKNGSLRLLPLEFNYVDYLKAFPMNVQSWGKIVHNETHRYSGEYDLLAVIHGEPSGKKAICDLKRNVQPDYVFPQMAAYAKCEDGIEMLRAIPVKCATKQGYSTPTDTTDIDKWFEVFLDKRKRFKKRFGI